MRAAIASDDFGDKTSDDRFLVAFSAATPRAAKSPAPIVCNAADGTTLARIRDDGQRVSLVLDKRATAEFAALSGRRPSRDLRGIQTPRRRVNERSGATKRRTPRKEKGPRNGVPEASSHT